MLIWLRRHPYLFGAALIVASLPARSAGRDVLFVVLIAWTVLWLQRRAAPAPSAEEPLVATEAFWRHAPLPAKPGQAASAADDAGAAATSDPPSHRPQR